MAKVSTDVRFVLPDRKVPFIKEENEKLPTSIEEFFTILLLKSTLEQNTKLKIGRNPERVTKYETLLNTLVYNTLRSVKCSTIM